MCLFLNAKPLYQLVLFATSRARAGEQVGLPFQVHPHQLRHACGYYLAAQGHDTRAIQDYLGHKNIHHTVRYTSNVTPKV